MGIPSFYKRLIQTIKALVSSTQTEGHPTILGFDANCAIYDCVASLSKRIPYDPAKRTMWEAELIQDTLRYFEKVIKEVNPSEAVWIAFDGVAPMAKIRQQRGRRFKSIITTKKEQEIRGTTAPKWDTNAITPGTPFMDQLATAFHAWAKTRSIPTRISAANESGEGEQKLMAWLRAAPTSHMVVYGLDADLIILALLHLPKAKIQLYREDTVFGKKSHEKQFLYLSIHLLATELQTKWNLTMEEFAACMNLLGNDFVPHGLGLKIKEEGMEHVLEAYRHIRASYPPIVTGYEYHTPTLKALLQELSKQETTWMLEIANEKLSMRPGQYCSSSDPVERALAEWNDAPIAWGAEKALLTETGTLRSNYKEIYQQVGLWGASYKTSSEKYLEALAWCFAYYNGIPVDLEWYYPWWIAPPLDTILVPERLIIPSTKRTPLEPTDQLAMVLPMESYHLLPTKYQQFPKDHPELFPVQAPFFSLGRRFLWECELMIPLVQPATLCAWNIH
jgi:5'-3' exonuclease